MTGGEEGTNTIQQRRNGMHLSATLCSKIHSYIVIGRVDRASREMSKHLRPGGVKGKEK